MNDGWWATRYQAGGRVWDDARLPEVDALVKELGDTFAELGWEVPNDVAAVLNGGSVEDKMEARNALVELVGSIARFRARMNVAYRGGQEVSSV